MITKHKIANWIEQKSFDYLFTELDKLSPDIALAYGTRVRHYVLKNHTEIVLNNFINHFITSDIFVNKELFVVFLLLHDIGKPKAYISGNINMQHKKSLIIIESIWKQLPFNCDELEIIKALLSSDYIGKYFQKKESLDPTKKLIVKGALSCKMQLMKFFKVSIIYYQCDVAAYTKDAGGYPFLEHLFEYRNGEKVFDKEEGLIRFSPKYWKMYLILKKEIELCQ